MKGPSWREVGSLTAAILLFTASAMAYAFTHFADKGDTNSCLQRIESKLDCLIDHRLCR